jgi:hypothetical protein
VALPAVVEVRISPATAEEQHRQLRTTDLGGRNSPGVTFAALSIVFVARFMKETKGVRLENIG